MHGHLELRVAEDLYTYPGTNEPQKMVKKHSTSHVSYMYSDVKM